MFNFIKKLFVKPNQDNDFESARKFFAAQDAQKVEKNVQKHAVENYGYIICNGRSVPLVGATVIQKLLPTNCWSKSKKERAPQMIVTHWDVTVSAERCYNTLKNLKISTHFVIDNDGTIYQLVDTNDVAWHAGPTQRDRELWSGKKLPSWNSMSIGVDFSNAYYEKYRKNYVAAGHGERPLITSKVNGMKLGPHLGFYPKQIEAYKVLVAALCKHYKVPAICPHPVDRTNEDAAIGKFSGVLNHFNLTRNKIDCAGLDLETILSEIRENNEKCC